MNIQLSYLYRDGANYKQNDVAVFSNVSGLNVNAIDATIRSQLIDGCWFYASKWGLKDLHAYQWDNDIDHEWHEYDGIEETGHQAINGDISSFLQLISGNKYH